VTGGATDAETGQPRAGFIANVNLVFLAHVANAALVFGVTVIVSRQLGPEGRGVYALFLLTASMAQLVLSLGMNVSSVYELGKKLATVSRVVANTQHVVIFAAAVSAALVLLAWPTIGDALLDNGAPYWAFAFVVPLFVNYNVLATVLQGVSRFQAMNLVILAQPFVMLLLVVALAAVGDIDTTDAIIVWSIASLAAIVVAFWFVRTDLRLVDFVRLDRTSLWRQVVFGVKGQVGNLIQLLNYRLDQYIVLIFVNTAGVGIYAVSVAISQSVWFGANAISAVLLPRLTADTEADAARTTPIVCRGTLLLSAIAAGGLAAVSPWLVPTFFGTAFEDALIPLLWLLPGTVALAGSKILASYILARGQPLLNSAITIATLAVTLIADFALIPVFDVTGAAIASSIAYVVHFLLSLLAYQRLSGNSMFDAVFPHRDDVQTMIVAMRGQVPFARSS